ncbi:MAG: SPOR domain-containing protein [Treponemataceae bacterium]|nr:SPOR domain-containing protein [Treponemataceae bacterium]
MKRPWWWGCIAAVSVFLLPASSVWEGAAVQADGGLLPEKGFFIATSSFPRNTLVDIVNLENNRTLRVVVVQELDTAGLLALVSKEAAEYLGMKPRVVTRIRMSMPADPIAFSRFNEELVAPRDPDRDPSVFVEQNRSQSEKDLSGPATQEKASAEPLAENRGSLSGKAPEESPLEGFSPKETTPSVSLTEEPSPASDDRVLGKVPGSQEKERAPVQKIPPAQSETENKQNNLSQEAPKTKGAIQKAETALPEGVPPEEGKITDVPEPSLLAQPPQEQKVETQLPQEPSFEVPVLIAEEPSRTEEAPGPSQKEEKGEPEVPLAKAEAPSSPPPILSKPEETEMVLVPAEERPPVLETPAVQLPESSRVATIPSAPTAPPAKEEKSQGESKTATKEVSVEVATPGRGTEGGKPIEKGEIKEISPEMEKKTAIPERILHLPVVRNLERGNYYIQLGSFRSPAALEGAIAKLNPRYPAVVQVSENKGELTYRLFVGPLNQGESIAVLQQMKRLGYKDAFVKKEG